MRRGSTGRRNLSDADVRELVLVGQNERDLYEQSEIPWAKRFGYWMKKGTYDRERAVEAIARYHVPRVLEKYRREYGAFGKTTMADKMAIAKELMPRIEEHAREYAGR